MDSHQSISYVYHMNVKVEELPLHVETKKEIDSRKHNLLKILNGSMPDSQIWNGANRGSLWLLNGCQNVEEQPIQFEFRQEIELCPNI